MDPYRCRSGRLSFRPGQILEDQLFGLAVSPRDRDQCVQPGMCDSKVALGVNEKEVDS